MTCLDEDTILAWLAGDLDASAVRRAAFHVDECSECRQLVSALTGDGAARTPPSTLAEPGSILDGRWLLEEIAGRGGMGEVYRGRDLTNGLAVAVKRVLVDDARFAREARVLAALAHPAIVGHIADGVAETGTRYLVMDWLEGETLAARIARGPLTVEETLAVGAQVAGALGAAHASGIVHRDVKPGNIFLSGGRADEAKVLDFGLARGPVAGTLHTRTGALIGTPGYMAPEQARGDRDVGPPADVFSLGCVLYECLTGERAVPGTHVIAVLANLLTAKPPRARARAAAVPRGLDALLARMLARDPARRPQTGTAVLRELASLGSFRTILRWSTLVPILVVFAGLSVLAAGAAVMRAKRAPHAGAPSATPATAASTRLPPSTSPDAAAAYRAGMAAVREAAIGRARTELERAVALDPALAAAHLRLSIWTDTVMTESESRGHFLAARTHAGSLDASDRELLDAVEPVYLKEPLDLPETMRRLRAIALRHPDDAELALLGVGVMNPLAVPGDYDRVLALDPSFGYAWFARANAELRLNDLASARRSVERCLVVAPQSTMCTTVRLRVEAREGRCEEMESDARLLVALENGGEIGYGYLSSALLALGADRAAVESAVHARALAMKEADRRRFETLERAGVAAAFGDFTDAERQARAAAENVEDNAFVQAHVPPTMLLVDVLQEEGKNMEAGRVADDFLRRRSSWRSVASRPNDEPWPTLLAASVQAGLSGADDAARARAAWQEEWTTKLGAQALADIWIQGWARAAHGERDVAAAAATLPKDLAATVLQPVSRGWASVGFAHAYGARVQLAAGHAQVAADALTGVSHHCSVLQDPVTRRRAGLWAGQAYEALGQPARACGEYARVLSRWGAARPRSLTAQAARARADALGCGDSRR